jgi:acetate kinase
MIEAVASHFPDLPQVACFDTAFHNRMPEVAQRFALPQKLWEQGIRRYGFHGLSYEYVVSKLGQELGRRAIIAHLGNGASMVALRDGVSVDTSMGLTPTGGFIMGTRSGDLDPGVLIYLLKEGYSADELEELVDHKAGLLGVSGQASDMKPFCRKARQIALFGWLCKCLPIKCVSLLAPCGGAEWAGHPGVYGWDWGASRRSPRKYLFRPGISRCCPG